MMNGFIYQDLPLIWFEAVAIIKGHIDRAPFRKIAKQERKQDEYRYLLG